MESDEVVWFVTSRVTEARFWLHPILTSGLKAPNRAARRLCERHERHLDKRLARYVAIANEHRGPHQPELTVEHAKRIVRGLVGSAFARAQARHGVEIFALVVMSNHLHVLLRTRGKNLAPFMRDVKARITEAINLVTGKKGALWARRYDAQAVIDESGCCDRQGYVLGNPVMANLVDDPMHWPGLNLAYGLADEDRLEFEYLDRTDWHRAGRPDDLAPFFRKATLTLSPLPSCEQMPRELYRESVRHWIEQAQAKHQAKRASDEDERSKPVLGVDKVIFANFETRPRCPAKGRRPYVFGEPEACRRYSGAAVVRMQEYAELSKRYIHGKRDVAFPDGMYPPPIVRAA